MALPKIKPNEDNSLSQRSVEENPARERLASLDAFRGFTIAAMIFVIMVAGYRDLPLTLPWCGSAPVSTFKHASEDFDVREWQDWHGGKDYKQGRVTAVLPEGRYDVELSQKDADAAHAFSNVKVWNPKPLQVGEDVITVFDRSDPKPTFQGVGNGCTFTDLVAPFFVFIVGVAIPLSRSKRRADWWWPVGKRTLLLVLAGVLYISLALKGISWWWGILQAIGIAYFMGAAGLSLPFYPRLLLLGLLCAAHGVLSWFVPWWTHLPADMSKGFFTLANLSGDKLAPLNVHTTPWGSIGYGLITVVGTFIGEALATRDHRRVLRDSVGFGISCTLAGYAIHRLGIPMNKEYVSVSYCLFTAGLSAFCFFLCYWVIDVKGIKAWARPFEVFGRNPLLGYFLQPVVRVFLVQLGVYAWFTGRSGWGGMLWGALWTTVLWIVCLWFDRRKLFLKL
jgi:predicted acyltransferase